MDDEPKLSPAVTALLREAVLMAYSELSEGWNRIYSDMESELYRVAMEEAEKTGRKR